MKAWTDWACSRVISPADVGDMPPGDLAYWMGKFVFEVRKQNGDEYPPKSLCCYGLLLQKIAMISVQLTKYLDVYMDLDQAEPDEKEAMLWSSGQFGTHDGKALLNTVYYYNCKIFGLRSYDEHRNLKRTMMKKVVFISNMLISETSRIGKQVE